MGCAACRKIIDDDGAMWSDMKQSFYYHSDYFTIMACPEVWNVDELFSCSHFLKTFPWWKQSANTGDDRTTSYIKKNHIND